MKSECRTSCKCIRPFYQEEGRLSYLKPTCQTGLTGLQWHLAHSKWAGIFEKWLRSSLRAVQGSLLASGIHRWPGFLMYVCLFFLVSCFILPVLLTLSFFVSLLLSCCLIFVCFFAFFLHLVKSWRSEALEALSFPLSSLFWIHAWVDDSLNCQKLDSQLCTVLLCYLYCYARHRCITQMLTVELAFFHLGNICWAHIM